MNVIALVLIVVLSGCASRSSIPDYEKASNMMIFGGSKKTVKSDWGEPASVEVISPGGEVWVYNNRQNGKTFKFYFDEKGKLTQTEII